MKGYHNASTGHWPRSNSSTFGASLDSRKACGFIRAAHRIRVAIARHSVIKNITSLGLGSRGVVVPLSAAMICTVSGITFADYEPHWNNTIGQPGMDAQRNVEPLIVFDDGSGNGSALYAGGHFTSAGGVTANRIARWDGTSWSALGSGMHGPTPTFVRALAVFDDGSGNGPALYAGGVFTTAGGVSANHIAKWDGQTWSPLGSGMNDWVETLAVFDDGSGLGPALYAGGWFTVAGGVSANRIAKWDGATWSALGSGMAWDLPVVRDLAVFDDGFGGGPALYAGGSFQIAGGVTANNIAKWDGTSWSALGSGLNSQPSALIVYDDGTGPALHAGGWFTVAGGVEASYIARWDGTEWSSLGAHPNNSVLALGVYDDGSGSGPELYLGGQFSMVGDVEAAYIAKWNGESWSAVGGGTGQRIHGFAVFDDSPGTGHGPALFVGGVFATAGGLPANAIAKWQGCPSEPKCLPPDLNCDGVVGVADLLMLLAAWGPCDDCLNAPCPADLSDSCNVGVADLLILLGNWG